MSLNPDQIQNLQKIAKKLRALCEQIEDNGGDFASAEMLDLAASLLDRQIDLDMEFVVDEDDVIDQQTGFLYLDDGKTSPVRFSQESVADVAGLIYSNEDKKPINFENEDFWYLDESDDNKIDIMTPQELSELFNIELPEQE